MVSIWSISMTETTKSYYLVFVRSGTLLTTTEAAEAAAVAPSTIKRWADQGVLPFLRTAGGHRRFERVAIEQLLREQSASGSRATR